MFWVVIVDGFLEIIDVLIKWIKVGVRGYRKLGKSKFGYIFYC